MNVDLDACLAKSVRISDSSRPLLASVIFFFTLVGVISNLMLLSVFLIQWRTCFRTQQFAFFVLNMIASALIYSTTNFWVSIPCTINECPHIKSDVVMVILATPNTLGHWGYLLSSLAFTVYRFGVFMSKTFGKRTYCIKILIVSPLFLTILSTFGSTALGCYKRYDRFALRYTYNCSNCEIIFGISYIDVNFYGGQAIPLLMIIAYAFIIVNVYSSRTTNGFFHRRQSLADAGLAFQFIAICSSQYLAAFLFYFVPKMSDGANWGVLITNCIASDSSKNCSERKRLE